MRQASITMVSIMILSLLMVILALQLLSINKEISTNQMITSDYQKRIK
ncbi:hypothetical protein [Nicoliella lavandulae]|uniref:Uncharacterized protein n=1 Tax=Nicoliella lavandulae TaxID=3082954 RepID=A0ABU8SMF7_9LACO